MPSIVIGLDLGSSAVKAAVLKGSLRGWEVLDFLSLEVVEEAPPEEDDPLEPVDATDEPGQTQELPAARHPSVPPGVLAAARTVLDTIGEEQATVVTAMRAGKVSTWLIDMPFADRKRLEQTLPFEVENYVPWDLDDVVLDYEVVDQTEGGGARVFTAMAPRDRVGGFLDELADLYIDPRHVTVDAAALALLHPDPEPAVLVDVGAHRTLVCVAARGTALWVRGLDLGAVDLREPGEEGLSASGLRSWLARMRTTLLAAENVGLSVERVRLGGGGAAIPRLDEALAADLELEVERFQLPAPPVHADEAPAAGPEHMLAYALAVRAFARKGPQPVEFRRQEFAYQADSRLYARLGVLAVAAVVLLAVGLVAMHLLTMSRLDQELKDTQQATIETIQGAFPEVPAVALTTTRGMIAVMQEKAGETQQLIANLRGDAVTPLGALKDLSELVPADVVVDIEEYLVTDDAIRLRGVTDSRRSVDRIEAGIRARPAYAGAEQQDVNKTRDGQTRFMVVIPRTPPEENEG